MTCECKLGPHRSPASTVSVTLVVFYKAEICMNYSTISVERKGKALE